MQWQPLVLSDPPGPLRIAHSKSSAALRTFYSRDRRTDLENCTDTVTSWGKGYRTWIRFEGRTVKLFAAMFICASMLALLNNAQEKANKNSAANIGLAVGQKVPKFTARDQFGQEQSNETLKGSNGTVLLFFLPFSPSATHSMVYPPAKSLRVELSMRFVGGSRATLT
jgi:hypothetical protein